MRRLIVSSIFGLLIVTPAWAQGPPAQPSCEDRLDNTTFQCGQAQQICGQDKAELAQARATLRAVTAERDKLKAEAEVSKKSEPAKK